MCLAPGCLTAALPDGQRQKASHQVRAGLAPREGFEPSTYRLGGGLYWPGSASPVKLSSPLHLHKCWPGAYTVILAVVPPRAGECRFVRVTSVLIFARAPACVALCWREHPDSQGHLPTIGARQDLRCAPPGPAIRPVAIDTPVPAGRRYPTATQRTGVTGLFIWLRIDDQRQRSFVTGLLRSAARLSGAQRHPKPYACRPP